MLFLFLEDVHRESSPPQRAVDYRSSEREKIMTTDNSYDVFRKPKDYVVFVTIPPKNSANKKVAHIRVAAATSIAECEKLIADDMDFRRNSFGSLIAKENQNGNTYRIFKAVWTEQTEFNRTV